MFTDKLEIILATKEHAELWYMWRQEPKNLLFNHSEERDIPFLRHRLANAGTDLKDTSSREFFWITVRDEEPGGILFLRQVDHPRGVGEIGYRLKDAWHGQGLGKRFVRLLIDHVFEKSALFKLFAVVIPENIGSWKILEEHGFKREGCLREHVPQTTKRSDAYYYGLLRSEWANGTRTF